MGAHYNYSPTFLEAYNVLHVKKDQAGVTGYHLWLKKKREREGGLSHTVNYTLLRKAPKGAGTRLSLGKVWGTVEGRKHTLCPNFYMVGLVQRVQLLSQQFAPLFWMGKPDEGT